MSAQSYYKNRLGFDPQEALYDGAQSSSTVKSGSKSRTVHQYSATVQHSNGNNNHYDYRSNSPAKKLKQSSASYTSSSSTFVGGNSGSPGNGGVSSSYNVVNTSTGYNNNNNNQADGYEDALTQFKGTMSIWEYFVEHCDATGMTTVKWSDMFCLWFSLPRVRVWCLTFSGYRIDASKLTIIDCFGRCVSLERSKQQFLCKSPI